MKGPKLRPSDAVDEKGGYLLGTLPSQGYTLATYLWEPSCGMAKSSGVAFILHGIFGHTCFEWLAADENNHRTRLAGSVVDKLLKLNFTVVGHDHPGHGRSTGLHGYVDTHDHLRDCAIDVIEHFQKQEALRAKKCLVLAMSMGGTTAIRVCAKRPDLVDTYALLSPAVRPPDDMFGKYGEFLAAIRHLLGFLVPKLPVLKLPPSPSPVIRDAVEKDGMVHRGAVRVKMGLEFLRVYQEVNDTAHQLQFGSVVIFVGGEDQIVSPTGIQEFVDRIQSPDKRMFVNEGIGHEVFREPGCHVAIDQFVDWVKKRFPAER